MLKEFIIGQSKRDDSPFEVIDHSLKEAAPEKDWVEKARRAIKRSEIVIVMVGEKTHKAPGVLKEIAIAREEEKKIVQIIGYKDGNYTAVPNAGRLYSWNWENLKTLLA
ncbi:MAG: TIR domain-containing protein [Methylocella sp.]